jgi:hypothetical protein
MMLRSKSLPTELSASLKIGARQDGRIDISFLLVVCIGIVIILMELFNKSAIEQLPLKDLFIGFEVCASRVTEQA